MVHPLPRRSATTTGARIVSSLIPLQIDPSDSEKFSNITAYMNSLFAPDVRPESVITSAMTSGATHAWYSDQNSAALILRSWLAQWQYHEGDTSHPGYDHDAHKRCPSTDATLIGFLADYIKQHGLILAKPDVSATSSYVTDDDGNQLRVYSTTGWKVKHFINSDGTWNYGEVTSNDPLQYGDGSDQDDTVVSFLHWLMLGAHFVVPSENSDQKNGNGFTSFKDAFLDANLTARRTVTSHYASVTNTSCLNYLDIEEDAEPSYEPLIASFVLGFTTFSDGNTFFQLEGWPLAYIPVGGRHNADYQAYKNTLWNISTFGSCLYSERRSTPIFIAKTQFDLTMHTDTMMPHYDGAGSHQGWMHTNLLVTG
jgi:hypothetical protein